MLVFVYVGNDAVNVVVIVDTADTDSRCYNTPWSIPKGGGGGQTRHLLSAVFTISSAVGAHTLSTADKISLESLVAGVTIS